MNNININNIFNNNILQNNNSSEKSISIKDFSVNTLVNFTTINNNISDDYILNKIKINKKNEEKKISDLYENNYKECLLKINTAVELNLTDIIYHVGLSFFGYNNYNSLECLKYIQQKLKDKLFLTLIISKTDIFVSWKNIIDS